MISVGLILAISMMSVTVEDDDEEEDDDELEEELDLRDLLERISSSLRDLSPGGRWSGRPRWWPSRMYTSSASVE